MSFDWMIRILSKIKKEREDFLESQSGWEKYWNKKRITELEQAIAILKEHEEGK